MNDVWEGAAHKLKPIVSRIPLSPSTPEIRLWTRTRIHYVEIIFYIIGLRKIGNWVMGSNSIFKLTLSKPHSFLLLCLQEQSQEDLPGTLGMPGVYQALPSEGLSFPELQHLVNTPPSHCQ